MKNKRIHFLLLSIFLQCQVFTFAQKVGVGTLTPAGAMHVKGSENVSQLIIDANLPQSNTIPLLKLRNSLGNDLLWIHCDDSTNVFMGLRAGKSNTLPQGGTNNTFLGAKAAFSNSNGKENTVVGANAMYSNTKGSMNTVIGSNALYSQSFTQGMAWYPTRNVAIGVEALYFNQPTNISNGIHNTALGTSTLRYNTTGNSNTAAGTFALSNNTTGSKNTAVGSNADVLTGNLTNATAIGFNAKVDTSNALILGGTGVDAVRVGIGTQKPKAVLDINGDVIFRTADITIDQSINLALDVNTFKFSSYRISIGGAEDIYSVGGITAGQDGRILTFFNSNPDNTVRFYNEDPDADPVNRIITGSNENFILQSLGVVSFQYDTAVDRWIIKSSSKTANESVWGENDENIYFNEFVGIGTEEPTVPLTIQTGINEIGFTQMSGESLTALSTSITDIGAAIGTTSEDVFSLQTGGISKMHILPDGRVVMGEDPNPNDFSGNNSSRTAIEAKLTLETPINTTGWMHIGGTDSIIVREAIGGISASIGTETNHAFRLNANGLGRLHLLPDGNIIIGNNIQGPIGKLTAHTMNNSYGFAQVGGSGQIIATRIGGSSAGIGTFTNHIMRIFANDIAAINIDPLGNVAIGTMDPLPGYKLSVNGNVKARELVIETIGWPDYVFDSNYELSSLQDLENFIQLHHHLPNIPSAKEIEDGGLHVGDTQKMMMEKIEELTLYIISLNKEVTTLKKEVEDLKNSGN